ncbi:tRNA-dihydrouridine synthase family protein [Nitrogeniibacter mangrovi]|uniref:tRNA-dihydrouridine(16) synthase n=1 Tax=Nitrogeniibacter mangrovi TaxID=2016596 RepID=A0A6C1B682_9RHOO|nr:tRNA-dihydrouridine synthase family protein [Nitrogeniibacter mangrovi]QID18218.1 tRNA-dihydrouridine synthase family protein [Nitrogeniibacter mangrovi]
MRLMLAPMEGLADEVLREALTELARYDQAVTEFVRVSANVVPRRSFLRVSPELRNGGRTRSGTPVQVQLLGADPQRMAASAAVALPLSPAGIDLNFGCPAPTVNRHRGGAVLLDEPETLHAVAAAVRQVMPVGGAPLSAKMRLGVADKGRAVECAQALAAAGVERLVVHARTKLEGYRPPAHWSWVARIAEAVPVPVVANGEVWTVADWRRCRAESGVADVMIGRGAVADPFLARDIRSDLIHDPRDPREADWQALKPVIAHFWQRVCHKLEARHAPGRLKQWLNLLGRRFPQAAELFAQLRPLRELHRIDLGLQAAGIVVEREAA